MHEAVSVFGAVGYSYGFAAAYGAGVRFQWILVPKGFLKRLPKRMHDEFGIEPGIDFFHAGYSVSGGGFSESWDYNEYTPLVGALWNIWLNENLAVYPKIDIGYRIASWSETVSGGSTTTIAHADLFPLYFQGARPGSTTASGPWPFAPKSGGRPFAPVSA